MRGPIIIALILCLVFLTACPGPSPVTGGAVAGVSCDYGDPCCPGDVCDQGECQGGMCVHCGYFGETCCFGDIYGRMCEEGSECILGRCQVTDEFNYMNRCGLIGYPPCYDDHGEYCNYGVYDFISGVCEHCGFLEQPCCTNTDYECDYGYCVNGYCKKTRPTTGSSGTGASSPGSTNSGSSVTSGSGSQFACGNLNEDCCEQEIVSIDPVGGIQMTAACNGYLECRGGVCVEGPDYES